ncbi:MAG TPA: J domain-containing protein, partial [bacterium]
VRKTYSVTIPAGIGDGEQIRLAGQGLPRQNGRAAGDLIATVRIEPHRFFERRGDDVYCSVALNLAQAALGSTVCVKTPTGKKINLKIPAGTQDGTEFRIPGMGVDRKGRRGDQYVRVKVRIPEKPSPQEKEWMDRLARKSGKKR